MKIFFAIKKHHTTNFYESISDLYHDGSYQHKFLARDLFDGTAKEVLVESIVGSHIDTDREIFMRIVDNHRRA